MERNKEGEREREGTGKFFYRSGVIFTRIRTLMNIVFFSDFVAATAAWPRQEQPCPIAGDFCMNGGTCLFFETVGEPACR